MTDPAGYAFIPWVRRGLASLARSAPSGNSLGLQVSLAVNNVAATPVSVRLHGPGQVTGIDPRAMVRTEPRGGSASFEPNYFPCVEFATADFPWLFSPALASGSALRPWLCLAVVREQPGVTLVTRPRAPALLQFTNPAVPADELPNLDQIAAWAHAQIAGATVITGAAVQSALDGASSGYLSRLICPRKLDPLAGYLACLVPTYHAGVQIGVSPELPVSDADIAPAWGASVSAPFTLPVYFSWRFSTGDNGDFASLARRMKPPKEPLQLGLRDMDASAAGFGLPAFPGLVLGLEGALLSPETTPTPWPAGMQNGFAQALRPILVPAPAAVPIVSPPVYGAVPAGAALPALAGPPVWMGELNLDPRFRAAAGMGAAVVRANQESLMASAWDQYQAIRQANQLLRQMQLARAITASTRTRHLQVVDGPGTLMQITRPLFARLRLDPSSSLTLKAQVTASRLAPGAVTAAFRRLNRRGGPIGRLLYTAATPSRIVERLNMAAGSTGAVVTLAPRVPPQGAVLLESVSAQTSVANLTTTIITRAAGWSAVVLARSDGAGTAAAPPVASQAAEAPAAPAGGTASPAAGGATVGGIDAGATGTVGIGGTGGGVVIHPIDTIPIGTISGVLLPRAPDFPSDFATQRVMAARFKAAATAVANYVSARTAKISDEPERPPLAASLGLIQSLTLTALDPATTFVTRARARLTLPTVGDPLQPLLGAPAFPQPMSRELDPQQLLPGVERVPDETAALLVTNPTFVEAFMVGLNDEMRRELAWRQYPVNQRATFFTHFWSTGAGAATSDDIPAIASWDPSHHLGDNATAHGEQVVLLLRGELLRRYPNSIISAVQAQLGPSGVRTLGTTELFPLFRGSIDPDMVFFGFALGKDTALAGAGWYFVLAEHPTEPRFGFEPAAASGALTTWNDLGWPQVAVAHNHVDLAAPPPSGPLEGAAWNSGSAQQAFITFRRPIRVALHATALLG
jgi:hypothetical protein